MFIDHLLRNTNASKLSGEDASFLFYFTLLSSNGLQNLAYKKGI